MTVLVTGGAGFIGSNFVIDWLQEMDEVVINLDKLTYAGNLNNLADLEDDDRHIFVMGDIGDKQLIVSLLRSHAPRAVISFAAESHVDRSIHGPEAFMQTNIIGTFRLLEAVRGYWEQLPEPDKTAFRFLHVSTDEVYGDTDFGSKQSGLMPSLASKVKSNLNIKNPNCVAYDLIFGCPGWLEGLIQAYNFIKAGAADKCLVIGAETLSRVVDKVDRDSMIFSDGAGAVIVEKSDSENGVVAYKSVTYTDNNEIDILNFERSYDSKDENKYIKMKGRKVYEFALKKVPEAMKECIEKANVNIDDIKKIFIHQANMKMDDAIVKRLYRIHNKEIPKNILPMNIQSLGNSSVATIPTLFDQVLKGKIMNHKLNKNDLIVFASVGAGMNVNAMVYKI